MNKYIIHGGRPLFGEVTISGAKNAAVAIIPAALLVDGVCRIENIPQISDVTLFFSILDELGARVRVLNQHAVEIDCRTVRSTHPSYDMARRIRASYYLLGALLGRFGEATVAMPGGCNFGVRPIDQHVKGFRAMGAEVTEGNFVHAAARGGRLSGANVYMDVVSVGATMNIMMAAVLADGTTTIENAAKEPHIVDLANFLNSMGADIKGAGTDSIRIKGVERLSGGTYCIIPDQIEAGTYMAAVAAAGGGFTLHSDRGWHYRTPDWVRACGEAGVERSMSRKGHSPDNAACEGFFGRLKVEFFHGRDWRGVSAERFAAELAEWIRWYREGRLKAFDEGGRKVYDTIAGRRRRLGLAA